MYRRKIQLVAGTTYSISLPKDWVRKNNLKEQNEVVMTEKNDRTLVLSSHASDEKELNSISLNIDEYVHDIDQILFAIYYLGIENITLFSKNELAKDSKSRIRKTLVHMSGTEIVLEDKNKMVIRVLLDKSKVSIKHIIYRIYLIIELSATNLLEGFDIEEIKINEAEIDRLYNLSAKIVSLALIDTNILQSSEIKNASLIPSYFLISKRLENIADSINHLADYMQKNSTSFESKKEILAFVKSELGRSISYLMKKPLKLFEKIGKEDANKMLRITEKIKDKSITSYLGDIIRYIVDIEEEIVNISFYEHLIRENVL